jgi:aspartyl-tRNA(Asn)/glutamyl-tRNA(Gln) amidotransferase subunit A
MAAVAQEIARLDAHELAQAFRNRSLSPAEATEAAIKSVDSDLNAICTENFAAARLEARGIEKRFLAGEPLPPLAGVPVTVKDLILTKGLRTVGGSVAYEHLIPDEDDVAVERLRKSGAIILGKTNVSELGYSLTGDNPVFGVTRNPYDRSRTSGGSSAGAAVAVATGVGPIALGSDGGGSIRYPAACCGVFGFKPSMGRVPLYPGCRDERLPGLSSWESLEHIGPLSRTVADAALVLNVIAGPDPRDRHSIPAEINAWTLRLRGSLKGKVVGLCLGWGPTPTEGELAEAARNAAKAFEELGCEIEEFEPGWGGILPHFRSLMAFDSDLEGMRALAARHRDRMSINLTKFIDTPWTAEMFCAANVARKTVANEMARLLTKFDFLLTPVMASPPPLADKQAGADDFERPLPTFTCIANMTGQPAASLPAGRMKSGLPIGVQLLGRHLGDADLIAACAAFEAARPWREVWPNN